MMLRPRGRSRTHSGRSYKLRPTPSFEHQNTGVQKKEFLVCKQQRKIALISNCDDSGGKNVLLFHIKFARWRSWRMLKLPRSGQHVAICGWSDD